MDSSRDRGMGRGGTNLYGASYGRGGMMMQGGGDYGGGYAAQYMSGPAR
jgi:hypothetical protein